MSIFYLDFKNLNNASTAAYVEMPHKQLIDTSNIGTNDKKQTWAITFQVGDNWLLNPGKDFTPAFRYYHAFSQFGNQVYQNIGAHQRNNKIGFGYTFDYFTGLEITPEDFKPYRNRWLALVSATSDNSDDFENWEVTEPLRNQYQYCVRNLLVDIESKEIIGKFDTYAYNIKGRLDLTQQWYAAHNYEYTDTDCHDRRFLLLGIDNNFTQAENQFRLLSAWTGIGTCLDPVKFWPDLVGKNLKKQVGGCLAWSTLEFEDQTQMIDPLESIYNYRQIIKSNGRWPDSFWRTKLYNYTSPSSNNESTQPINRTVRFFGLGIGDSETEIRVIYKFSSYNVAYYKIPTKNIPITKVIPEDQHELLFTLELPVNFSGQIPMSVHCTQGNVVVLTSVDANYCYEDSLNPRYTVEDKLVLHNPKSTAEERARIWRARADPPFTDIENSLIDEYIKNPSETTYQRARIFFILHGLAQVSSGPDIFRSSCFFGDARQNCMLNDVPINDNRQTFEQNTVWPGVLGTFQRFIPQHSTLTFDLDIRAGML